jgi:ADP-heptose:LPS heptosyltransferase
MNTLNRVNKKVGMPQEVSIEWFDRLVHNSMMLPVVLRRISALERRLRRLEPKRKGKIHILVWRDIGGIGDILMQSPIARGLKTKYPKSYIIYQVPEQYLAIPKHNPYVDETQLVETPFCEDGFDRTIKLSNPCPAAVYESTKEPYIIKHRIDLFLEAANLTIENRDLIYHVKDDEKQWAEEFLRRNKALDKIRIGFQIRSAEARRDWERWRELTRLIYKHIQNSKIFIFDHDPKMAWKDKRVINICGFKIEDVASLIERLDLIIGSDSGLLHLAGAVGTKILGLFGPTNPFFRLSTYKADWIWLNKRFSCIPCWYSFSCGNSKCMRAITPKMVLEKIKKVLC